MPEAQALIGSTKMQLRNPVPGTKLLFAVAAAAAAVSCGPAAGTPEEQLREWVGAMETAAEEEAHGAIMELIAPSYNDARGHGREDVDKLLRLYFVHQDRIALLSAIDEIVVNDGTAATVVVTVGMAGTEDNLLGVRADAVRFELELESVDEPRSYADWQLLSARWGELGEPLR